MDWWSVAFNSVWILGASIILATFSYHHGLAAQVDIRPTRLSGMYSLQIYSSLGVALFGLGWALSQAGGWWDRMIWASLAACFGWKMVCGIKGWRNSISGRL